MDAPAMHEPHAGRPPQEIGGESQLVDDAHERRVGREDAVVEALEVGVAPGKRGAEPAQARLGFEQRHVVTGADEAPCGRQAGDPAADDGGTQRHADPP
jgi:hypothetical protein